MDMNTFLAKQLELQERIAVALEAVAKNGGTLVQGALLVAEPCADRAPTTVAAPAGNAPAPAVSGAAAGGSTAQAQGGSASATSQADAGNAAASTPAQASAPPAAGGSAAAGEKVTVDKVRAKLQAYAVKHGNPAAMSMLTKHGGKSVSECEPNWAALVADLDAALRG